MEDEKNTEKMALIQTFESYHDLDDWESSSAPFSLCSICSVICKLNEWIRYECSRNTKMWIVDPRNILTLDLDSGGVTVVNIKMILLQPSLHPIHTSHFPLWDDIAEKDLHPHYYHKAKSSFVYSDWRIILFSFRRNTQALKWWLESVKQLNVKSFNTEIIFILRCPQHKISIWLYLKQLRRTAVQHRVHVLHMYHCTSCPSLKTDLLSWQPNSIFKLLWQLLLCRYLHESVCICPCVCVSLLPHCTTLLSFQQMLLKSSTLSCLMNHRQVPEGKHVHHSPCLSWMAVFSMPCQWRHTHLCTHTCIHISDVSNLEMHTGTKGPRGGLSSYVNYGMLSVLM